MTDTEERLKAVFQFQLSLRSELFYAMQNLFSESARVHGGWKKRALQAFSDKQLSRGYPLSAAGDIWPVISDALTTSETDLKFEQIVERLHSMKLEDFKFQIINGMVHFPDIVEKMLKSGDVKASLAKVPKKKQEWLAHIGLYPYVQESPIAESLQLLLDRPVVFRKIMIDLMTEFWRSDFSRTWQQLRLPFQKSLAQRETLFHVCSLAEFAKQTMLKIEFDSSKGEIRALRGGAKTAYEDVCSCIIMPSAFNEKRFWTAFDENESCSIYIPLFDASINLDHLQIAVGQPGEHVDPYLVFKALGDTTRFAMLKLIGSSARTSQDIAAALSVSKPTVSHHLHLLRQAHLVIETPRSGSILLSINTETLDGLSEMTSATFLQGADFDQIDDKGEKNERRSR